MKRNLPLNRRFPVRFQPRLESLETRDCPSCSVVHKGDTLFIVGDREANQIAIADTREGGITVTCDGSVRPAFQGVRVIDIKTGGGNDEVSAAFENHSTPDFVFRVDLGTGNDILSIRGVGEHVKKRGPAFDINAGAGNDDVAVTFSVPSDGDLALRADLGAGDD